MGTSALEFEKPIAELERQIEELKKLAGDAASKARQQQEGLTRASEQDRKEQERKEKEAQARAKDAAQQGLDLNRLVSQGKVDEAQRVLGAMRRSQQEELDLAGSNVAKRLAIVQRTGPAIVAGERRIAERTRDVAVKDAKAWADAEIEKAKASLTGQALRSRLQDIEAIVRLRPDVLIIEGPAVVRDQSTALLRHPALMHAYSPERVIRLSIDRKSTRLNSSHRT